MAKYKPKSKWQEQKIVGRSDKQEYDIMMLAITFILAGCGNGANEEVGIAELVTESTVETKEDFTTKPVAESTMEACCKLQ